MSKSIQVFSMFAFFFIMAGTSSAEPIHNLTLQETVSIGLKNSRELTIANLQQEVTKASLREALSCVYPKMTGNINSSYNNTEKTGGVRTGTDEGYNNNLSLSLNQLLFTGGKTANAIKCANEEIKACSLKIEQVKNEAIYKIAISYWNFKKTVEFKKACEKRVDYAGSILDIASARYKEGIIPEVEMMKQEVNLAQAKEELIKATSSEKVAGDNLRSLLRIEGEINIIDEPAFVRLNVDVGTGGSTSGRLVPVRIPLDEEKTMTEAIINNPEVAGREAEIKSKELQVKIVRADYLPTVNFIGSYNWRGQDRKDFKKSLDDVSKDSWTGGINIEIPIFNGFYTASKVNQAELIYKQTEENLDSLKDRITLETKEILARLLEAEARVRVSEKNKELGNEILRVTKIRYELGKATISEIKEAEEIFIRSSCLQTEAMIDYELSRMNLLRIMGKIGEMFGEK